jgi:molecular chaperone GrpE (heat shock protein)
MSGRTTRHRRRAEQLAKQQTDSAEPNLLEALGKARAETAALVRVIDAHREQTEVLLRALNQQELDTTRLLNGVVETIGAFDRLLAYGTDVDFESYRASVHMTSDALEDLLWNHGIELFGRVDEIADPETHHVLEECADSRPENAVIKVVKRGIRHRGHLLQFASVIVSSGKSPRTPAQEADR